MNKEIRNTLAWIVCATGTMGLAVWQAQVSIARDLKARHQTLPPPPKTRSAIRPVAVPWAGDPVADYIARCEKGLTDQEIGWIIEDFQNAGLDVKIAGRTSLFAFRANQHRWYHDTLVDGLRLDAKQSAEVTSKLGELFDLAKANYVEASRRPQISEINGIWKDRDVFDIYNFISASVWLKSLRDPFDPQSSDYVYQPWNLCSLTPEQLRITWKSLHNYNKGSVDQDLQDSSAQSVAESTHQPGVLEFLLSNPTISSNGSSILVEFLDANFIFPFTVHQEFRSEKGAGEITGPALLSKVRLLHPAQFKTLLLFNPAWAGKIQQEMNTASP